MPVDLHKIPQALPLPAPPGKLRWLIFIIVFTSLLGGGLLVFWPDNLPTNAGWFWFSTIFIPFFSGGLCYACRLRYFENKRDRILWWNQLHQEQYKDLVVTGQRAAAILGMSYITPGACNKLADFLLKGNSRLQSVFSPQCQTTITCARLETGLSFVTSEIYRQRLEHSLQGVIKMLQPELDNIPGLLTVRIRHDGVLGEAEILSAWQRAFPENYAVDSIKVAVENDGLMWLDAFLDSHEEQVILSVEINLFLHERNGQAESVSAILLASPEWQEKYEAKSIARVHRPVASIDMQAAVNSTALWGRLTPGEIFTLWRVQLQDALLSDLILQLEREKYLPGLKSEHLLDHMFGKPGAAVGNIALICASENAQTTGEVQWLIVQDLTSHQAIVRPAS